MPNNYLETSLVDKAIIFATNAHHNSERRGKGFAYIIHPLEAMVIVATMSNDPDLLAASVLHDTVEDTDVTLEDIKREFGSRVMEIVQVESIVDDGSLSWRERKQAYINRIKNSSKDSKIVALGDKLSNLRTIYLDHMEMGEKIWDKFHCNEKEEIKWYYVSLAEALEELKDTYAYKEYVELLNKTFD